MKELSNTDDIIKVVKEFKPRIGTSWFYEYAEGVTLENFIKSGVLSEQKSLEIQGIYTQFIYKIAQRAMKKWGDEIVTLSSSQSFSYDDFDKTTIVVPYASILIKFSEGQSYRITANASNVIINPETMELTIIDSQ